MRDFQADIGQVDQHVGQRTCHALQRAQGASQQLGGLLTDIGDAQRIDEARQRRRPTRLDGLQQVAAGYLGEAFERDDLLESQAIEIGRRANQLLVHQLLDDLVAEAVDIHGAA